MADDRIPVPVLRRAVKDLAKAAKEEMTFTANDFQKRVKARFYRRLAEMSHILDKETAFSEERHVVSLAGTDRVLKWLEDPGFAAWFVDEEYVTDTIASLQQDALGVIRNVIKDDDASDNDKLKAARMLLELGDQFPGRKSEVRFLDDRLNELTEGQTDKEIAKLEAALGGQDGDQTD